MLKAGIHSLVDCRVRLGDEGWYVQIPSSVARLVFVKNLGKRGMLIKSHFAGPICFNGKKDT